ncbi:hypothetical protein AAFF_G00024380 [Aldrovandia affinis]|uniref:Uncharacterized protein n=1 Tax=Aldrovandia affinis TaxID=143900 RepID=A0AAD7WZN4_9TELE|nr:hypothetical protein AAFF_G00024380 [Aldrovandia affinis]
MLLHAFHTLSVEPTEEKTERSPFEELFIGQFYILKAYIAFGSKAGMAGRGRGRGVAAFTFNIDALGLTRGSMPETALGPRALFPVNEYKPVPLKAGEDEDYMLALKQEMRGTMKRLPYNVPLPEKKADVERYKEKYTRDSQRAMENAWTPDWKRLPKELMPQLKKVKKKPGNNTETIRNKSLHFLYNDADFIGTHYFVYQ